MQRFVFGVVQELRSLGVDVPVCITVDSSQLMASCDGTSIAIPSWQAVRLLPGLREGLRRTIIHEYGHAFLHRYWTLLVSAGVYDDFGDFDATYPSVATCLVHKVAPATSCVHVSSYAEAHPHEDFAETFTHVIQHNLRPPRARDARLQRKINFVADMIRWAQ